MNTSPRNLIRWLGVSAALILASTAAQAAPIAFNLVSPDSRDGVVNSTYATTYNYSIDGLDLTVTGFSYNGSGRIVQDLVGRWDGLGVERVDSPRHAVDNASGDYDMLFLAFSQPVALQQLTIGWWYNDSDVSMLAYQGAGAPAAFGGVNLRWQDLLGQGWVSAGDYYDVAQNPDVNPNGIASQYWLVGAYNSNLGGEWLGENRNRKTGTDYFKLKGVAVATVPEPGSLALLGLALAGIGFARRRVA